MKIKTKTIHELAAKWREEASEYIAEAVKAKLRGDMLSEAHCRANHATLISKAAELEAALADQWQPIETAPKDGTVVWVTDCKRCVQAVWHTDEKFDLSCWRTFGPTIKPLFWATPPPLPAAPTPPKP